jgi:hypothetical protein
MNAIFEELTNELASLNDRLASLNTMPAAYTAPMAKDMTKKELFILHAFSNLLIYSKTRDITKLCDLAIKAGSELAEKLNQ